MVNIGKYDERYLLQRAEEIVISKTTGSNILDPDAEAAIPRFQPNGKIHVPFDCCQTFELTRKAPHNLNLSIAVECTLEIFQ